MWHFHFYERWWWEVFILFVPVVYVELDFTHCLFEDFYSLRCGRTTLEYFRRDEGGVPSVPFIGMIIDSKKCFDVVFWKLRMTSFTSFEKILSPYFACSWTIRYNVSRWKMDGTVDIVYIRNSVEITTKFCSAKEMSIRRVTSHWMFKGWPTFWAAAVQRLNLQTWR